MHKTLVSPFGLELTIALKYLAMAHIQTGISGFSLFYLFLDVFIAQIVLLSVDLGNLFSKSVVL